MLEYMLAGNTLSGWEAIDRFHTTTPSKRFSEIRIILERGEIYHKGKLLNAYLHSEQKTNGKKRWLEYSIKVAK